MRTVYRNKTYDTATARLIGERGYESHGEGRTVTERLYRKRTGEHFVCVTGGPSNRFAPRRRSDEYIVPLGYEEALAWARECLDQKTFDTEFGSGVGDGETMLSVRVSAKAARMLNQWVSRTGETKGDAVDRLITEHLS